MTGKAGCLVVTRKPGDLPSIASPDRRAGCIDGAAVPAVVTTLEGVAARGGAAGDLPFLTIASHLHGHAVYFEPHASWFT